MPGMNGRTFADRLALAFARIQGSSLDDLPVERLDDDTLGVVVTDPAAIVLGSDPSAMGLAGLTPASPAAKELAADAGATAPPHGLFLVSVDYD